MGDDVTTVCATTHFQWCLAFVFIAFLTVLHPSVGFIVLYPIGVAGEMISAYLTLPLIMKGMCPSFEGLVKECPSNAPTLLYVFLFQYL